MKSLSRRALASGELAFPHAPLVERPVRVLQIGDGVFLRGFVDWMIDVANAKGVLSMSVAVATARPHSAPPALAAQDGLYTVDLRGRLGGADIVDARVVSAVAAALDPHRQWNEMRRLAASPDLRFVVSNTTEAGLVDVVEPYASDVCPPSFPGKAAALSKARYDALGGDDAPGLVFLPCELIEANGAALKRFVLAHAERWGFAPSFAAWVETRCKFLDTLVDRIVPGFPKDEAEALFAAWGYRPARGQSRAVPSLGDPGAR